VRLRELRELSEAELRESNARLGSVTDALENLIECIVCANKYDNKERKSVVSEPCRHTYAHHHIACRTFYELVHPTHVNDSHNNYKRYMHTCM
jgi:hypothetical protein